jgi:hypothetical protein
MTKPQLTWIQFLSAAPYFTSLLGDALAEKTDLRQLEPNYRAALYFDVFSGEVSDGGITQYFFNRALTLPDFDLVPQIIAANPLFASVQPVVEAAYAAWSDCREQVLEAIEQDDWPEALFNQYSAQFEPLQTEFYARQHEVAQRFCHALILNPDHYFEMQPIEGVPAKGQAYIHLQNNTKHLRFKNGFPIGPNLFDTRDGFCKTVSFDDARNTLQCCDESISYFIHYPSQRSITKRFNDGILEKISTQISFWHDDGLAEAYRSTGQIEYAALSRDHEEIGTHYFYPNGQLSLKLEKVSEGQMFTRFWPNGKKNAQYVEDKNLVTRYSWCFDEQGNDLAPDGTGKLLMIYDENTMGERTWAEGVIDRGRLIGQLKRFEPQSALKNKPKLPG